jgi:catechol 2,3-dioxygenase
MNDNSLPDDTHIGHVRLVVSDLERALLFYHEYLGLSARPRGEGQSLLSSGEAGIILLEEQAAARPKPPRTTGLYHIAIRLPTRPALAVLLRRLIAARYPLQGASDHLVSEAMYLSDPDGNGLELYVDRPREQWEWQSGQLIMTTEPLDLPGLLAEGDKLPTDSGSIAPGTDIGHVHLQVSDLAKAEVFYHGLIGLDVTVRGYPGALFLSAGGYHHHLGLNTWAGRGAPPPPPGVVGLGHFSLDIQDENARQAVIARIQEAGLELQPAGGQEDHERFLIRDPDGNTVMI